MAVPHTVLDKLIIITISSQMRLLQRRWMGSFRKASKELEPEIETHSVSKRKRTFIDSQRIYARGGAGGQGLPKFGGVGGNGGDVVIVAQNNETLINLRNRNPTLRFAAGNGGNSTRFCLKGEKGADLEIFVPPGVELLLDNDLVIGDLNQEGDRAVAAVGGKGGCHDNQFLGLKGEARALRLNLKLIADVGLVGFPNAGKSTFLKAVSRAKPKIASYPFTTVRPQIGITEFVDFRRISVADLPGLIEGAHANFGMGHRFLKHVERTKLLLFVIDLNGFQLAQGYPKRSAFETVLLLNRELEMYRPDLLDKPAVLVGNKIDTDPDGRLADELRSQIKTLPQSAGDRMEQEMLPTRLIHFDDVLTMSAKNSQNTQAVMDRVRSLLDEYAEKQKSAREKGAVVHVDDDESEAIRKHGEHARRKLM